MGYLFMVSIGPIQSFIASARRTRDLWFGSRLLSELSKTVAFALVDGNNSHNELIFPAPIDKQRLQDYNDFTVANKIVAYIESAPEVAGVQALQRIKHFLDLMVQRLSEDVGEAYFDTAVARRQIEELVEYMWVAVPFERHLEAESYATKRLQLEELLAARKNTRLFVPVTSGRSGRLKSSIDGQLECVIHEDKYPMHRDSDRQRQKLRADLYYRFRAGVGERLSGVDLLKRQRKFYAREVFRGRRFFKYLPCCGFTLFSLPEQT